jgi:hypothetical protein
MRLWANLTLWWLRERNLEAPVKEAPGQTAHHHPSTAQLLPFVIEAKPGNAAKGRLPESGRSLAPLKFYSLFDHRAITDLVGSNRLMRKSFAATQPQLWDPPATYAI